MAFFPTKKPPLPLFLFLLLTTIITPTTTAIRTQTLDTVLSLLRMNSHALFANAIATSDLLFDLLSLPSATLLCPPDPHLFALDMSSRSPLSYTSSLRCHVIPNSSLTRLIIPYNHSSSSKPAMRVHHTLLPLRNLLVTRDPANGSVTVDGVEVVLPRLFYSREVSVFRLRGILPPDNIHVGVSIAKSPSSSPVELNLYPTVSSPAVSSPLPASFSSPQPGDRKLICNSPAGDTTPVTAPTSAFAASPGPGAGRFPGHYGEDRTAMGGADVEKCGPLVGERRMRCTVSDGSSNSGDGHVSFCDSDYARLI